MLIERRIAAAREAVFGACADFAGAAGRVSGIKRVEPLTDGPVGVGYRFRETREMFGREATEEMEVVAYEPPGRYTLGCTSCGARFETTMTFEPAGQDATLVRVEMCSRPITLMARLMAPLGALMTKAMRRCVERDLEDIARSVEG